MSNWSIRPVEINGPAWEVTDDDVVIEVQLSGNKQRNKAIAELIWRNIGRLEAELKEWQCEKKRLATL